MSKNKSLRFTANAEILVDDLDPALLADLLEITKPIGRDVSHLVNDVIKDYDVSGDPEAIRACLWEFGAWDDDELLDEGDNLRRIVWIASGDIRGEGYFYLGV